MKKQTLLLTTVLLSSATLFAQEQLPNNSFETWIQPSFLDSDWVTGTQEFVLEGDSNYALEEQNIDTAYIASGESSVLMQIKNVPNGGSDSIILPGTLGYSNVFTSRPDSISFWIGGITHYAFFAVYLYKEDGTAVGGFPDTSGNFYNFSQDLGFQKLTFPVNYFGTTGTPDSVYFTIQQSSVGLGTPGTKMYIDDVQFIYNNDSASGISTIAQNKVSVYPNPFTDKLTVEPNSSYRLFDLVGREVDKNNLSALPVGTYILTTDKGSTRVVKTEK